MIGPTAQHAVRYRIPQTGTTKFTDTLSTNFHFRSSRRGTKFSLMLKNQEFGKIAERKKKEEDR
jgi:hypothetical protein